MLSFWIHFLVGADGRELLDGGGYPVRLGDIPAVSFANGSTNPARRVPSVKLTVWADKAAALAFLKRTNKEGVVRDLGNRLEMDMPANPTRSAYTLVLAEVTAG